MNKIEEYIKKPIKKYIFQILLTKKEAKYSQLKQKETDNTLFNYHLQHLVDIGLIKKSDEKYFLTDRGIQETTQIDWNGQYFIQSVNRVMLFVVKDNKLLYNKRSREPWFGDTMPITGKLPQFTSVYDYSKMRLKEKTGIDANFTWFGVLRKIYKNHLDIFYHIMYSIDYSGIL
jgi:hypothetical protein